MVMPELPDFVTPTTRDSIFTSLGLDPGLVVSVQITRSHVNAQFIALDHDERLIEANTGEYIHYVAIPIQES